VPKGSSALVPAAGFEVWGEYASSFFATPFFAYGGHEDSQEQIGHNALCNVADLAELSVVLS